MGQTAKTQDLMLGLAEQLKLPLLQIARRAELASLRGEAINPGDLQTIADAALQLIDSYALGLRLQARGQQTLLLEPVSVAAVLYDSAQQLDSLAKFYGIELELRLSGKYGPVLANRQALQAALTSLGMALIEALPALESSKLTLQLAGYRCRYGIVAGVYSDAPAITAESLRRGRDLLGQSRQPLVDISHSGAAGVFVADAILEAMRLRLQATRHNHLYGLGAVLPLNSQLQLV